MRARSDNTRHLLAVALLSLCAPLVLLSGCGGSSGEGPQTLLADTFAAHSPIESGQVAMSFSVSAAGSSGTTEPLSVRLSGPFESGAKGRLPRFALSLEVSAGGHSLSADATATGSALYVQLAGSWYSIPASTYRALEESFAQATRSTSTARTRSTFSSLGIEPGKWLANPSRVGTATVGGVQTVHLSSAVDMPSFLADLTKLSQAGGALGLGSAVPGAGAISPSAVGELAKSIRAARVDVYTGSSDHTLRRLEVAATVTGTAQTKSLLGGLATAQVKLLLEFSDLGKPQTIAAPANPQPYSQLLPALQQLSGALQGTG